MSKQNAARSRAERAAAELSALERQNRIRQITTVGSILAGLVLVVVVGYFLQSNRDLATKPTDPPAGATDTYALAVGDPDAPDTVVVYEDFLCPFCAELEGATRERLAELAAEGEVYVEYRPFQLLGIDYSMEAASAFGVVLDVSGPEVAKEFHDLLFENQPSEGGPYPDTDDLVAWAVEAGADEEQVRGPIEETAFRQWVINASDAASKAGINTTPTVLVNGEPLNNRQGIEEQAADLFAQIG
ncbi:DsbA family protein [Nocardioides sp.]|uniref:DsbA family protein n=1 Tax=Nocardioides sp. TaxID=35761 RepID=UPI003564AE32